MKKRLWSIVLSLAMCLSLLSTAALAEETEATSPFDYITVSGVGLEQDDGMVSGAYQSVFPQQNQHGKDAQKASVTIKAVSLKNSDGTSKGELTYYVAGDSPSVHEIRLYGYTEIGATKLSVSGAEVKGTIEQHVYGDGVNDGGRLGGALYWYTVPVEFPDSGGSFELTLDGKPFQKISVVPNSCIFA